MKATEIRFTRRFNLGDYEHEEYTLVARIDENEDIQEVTEELKSAVLEAFKGKAEETKTKIKEKKNARTAKARDTDDEDSNEGAEPEGNESTDGESPDDDEAPDSKDSDNADDSTDDGETTDSDVKTKGKSKGAEKGAEKGAKKGKSESTSGKKYRSKAQDYNREIEQHKEIFSGVLKSVNPDWKKSEASKNKAKEVSQKMEGKEFLDANGEVLDSFTADMKKLLMGKSKK